MTVVTLFKTYSQDTVFEPQFHHPWNDLEQVIHSPIGLNNSFVSR